MEPHDLHSYRMQWPHHSSNEIVTEEVYEDVGDDDVIEEEYLVGEEIIPTNEINAISNTLDQSAAQNLIYMAQEGNMAMGDLIEEQVEQAENGDYNDQEYFECQVTEEVITDDWVQRQGEERIEIIIDSIESSQAQESTVTNADDDIDVSLPTVQDEYTASRPYPCDFCSRRFRKKANLINHMVAHQQERPHVCHLCGARYIRKSDLMQHLKIHAYIPEEQDPVPDHDQRPSSRGGKRSRSSVGGGSSSSNNNHHSSGATGLGRGGLGKSKPPPFERLIEDDVQLLCEVANQSQGSQDSEGNEERPMRFPVIDDRRPFVCQQCGLSFSREKALLSHTKSHGVETQFECEQCGEMFYDVASLREHEYSHANIVEYAEVGDQPSTSHYQQQQRYRQQQETEEEEEEFDDEDMDGSYMPVKQERMDREEEDDEDEYEAEGGDSFGIYYCDHCGMSFHRVNLLRQHVKTHLRQMSTSDEHVCKVCGDTFGEALDLLAHAEMHARHQCVKCLLCGDELADDLRLEEHVQTTHKAELTKGMCGVCGKQCKDDKSLQKHSFEHSSAMKKVLCPICKKSFQNKGRLKRHLLSHRKRAVQCDICMEEFQDGRTLMNHRHSHTTGLMKKFPCKECGKSFGSRSSQQIHARMHTGERPYGCRYCWKSFADGGTLRKHERIHTGEKPYGCVVCPRAFNQRVVLREHIRSHHSAADPARAGMPTPFFCHLCHSAYHRAEDLISDLIAHCDENTKRQRPIQIGPRKYKRRRKLKPHELKMMLGEGTPINEMGGGSEEEEEESNLVDSDACTEDAKPEIRQASTGGKRRVHNDHFYNEPDTIYLPQYSEEQDNAGYSNSHHQQSTGRSKTRGAAASAAAAASTARQAEALNSSGRPKMIHTEKSRVAAGDGKRKTVTTRSAPKASSSSSSSMGTRRSRRTEAKVEEEQETEVEMARVPVKKENDTGLGMSSMELADVLENKKRNNDKYSVDIVNDLESILCSPIRPRVSESSITGGIAIGGETEDDEELVVDAVRGPAESGKSRSTIIECRRTYMPSSAESKKPSKQYTAKIAAAVGVPSGQYGIVRVSGAGGGGSSSSNGNKSKSHRSPFPLLRQTSGGRAIKEHYSTTEDEGETLDDLLHREMSGPEESAGEEVIMVKAMGATDLIQCHICNEYMRDKYELMKHAQTHF